MDEEKPDFGSTTAVIAYVRSHVTPKMLWSAVGTLVAALVVAITAIVTTKADIHQLKETVAESKRSVADMQPKLDMLQDMRTDIAVIKSTMGEFKAEQDRERARWERVESVAEEAPHARRRRK